jgi:hypothetical protein
LCEVLRALPPMPRIACMRNRLARSGTAMPTAAKLSWSQKPAAAKGDGTSHARTQAGRQGGSITTDIPSFVQPATMTHTFTDTHIGHSPRNRTACSLMKTPSSASHRMVRSPMVVLLESTTFPGHSWGRGGGGRDRRCVRHFLHVARSQCPTSRAPGPQSVARTFPRPPHHLHAHHPHRHPHPHHP